MEPILNFALRNSEWPEYRGWPHFRGKEFIVLCSRKSIRNCDTGNRDTIKWFCCAFNEKRSCVIGPCRVPVCRLSVCTAGCPLASDCKGGIAVGQCNCPSWDHNDLGRRKEEGREGREEREGGREGTSTEAQLGKVPHTEVMRTNSLQRTPNASKPKTGYQISYYSRPSPYPTPHRAIAG